MIIMLCSSTENGRQKCSEYWAENNQKISFKIKVNEEKSINKYLKTRNISVTDKNGKNKIITQLHFIGWPDHGVPNVNDVYETFISMIKTVNANFNAPIITHCSAGVGRTGTFISCFSLYNEIMEQIEKKKTSIEINIFNLVRKLKEMRLFLVESPLQYCFVYGFVSLLIHFNFK